MFLSKLPHREINTIYKLHEIMSFFYSSPMNINENISLTIFCKIVHIKNLQTQISLKKNQNLNKS